ncbi:hypothetical protein F4779DRAFT_279936 [Xylariaceae sp. FL0662B]|nr:hypothetical protein F4779DRAFT_279936 [Xylariaceae sp. FL0662B]
MALRSHMHWEIWMGGNILHFALLSGRGSASVNSKALYTYKQLVFMLGLLLDDTGEGFKPQRAALKHRACAHDRICKEEKKCAIRIRSQKVYLPGVSEALLCSTLSPLARHLAGLPRVRVHWLINLTHAVTIRLCQDLELTRLTPFGS